VTVYFPLSGAHCWADTGFEWLIKIAKPITTSDPAVKMLGLAAHLMVKPLSSFVSANRGHRMRLWPQRQTRRRNLASQEPEDARALYTPIWPWFPPANRQESASTYYISWVLSICLLTFLTAAMARLDRSLSGSTDDRQPAPFERGMTHILSVE
jgi:hypothetical protein